MSSIEDRVKKIVCEQLGAKEEDVNAKSSFIDAMKEFQRSTGTGPRPTQTAT